MAIELIEFSFNWNGKLDCKSFTSIRVHNDRKYVTGNIYHVVLKRNKVTEYDYGLAKLIDKKVFRMRDLNEWMARLDTGYGKEETLKIIRTMYKWAVPETQFDYLLFSKNPHAKKEDETTE
jgi:hypothetical protein